MDSALAYFPLEKGNTWEFSVWLPPSVPFGYSTMSIVGDTLMPNGKFYYILWGGNIMGLLPDSAFLRVDSSTANIDIYDPLKGLESSWDSLLARRSDRTHMGFVYFSPNVFILGIPTITRNCGFPGMDYNLSYGFGVTRRTYVFAGVTGDEIDYIIVYAKVDGKEYGTPLSIDHVKSPGSGVFTLQQNYPNPFNPSATIEYGLPVRARALLTVFNTLGQVVTTLVDEPQEAGYHDLRFDGSGLASGVCFYRLQAGSFMQTKKLLLLH